MIKGSANSIGMPQNASNGDYAYAWEHSCNPTVFRCRQSIYQNGEWIANGLYPDSYCPLIDTDDYCNNPYDPNGSTGITGGNGKGDRSSKGQNSLLGGIAGGLFPFGLGNIFNKDQTDFIKKALLIIALAIVALLIFKFMRKK